MNFTTLQFFLHISPASTLETFKVIHWTLSNCFLYNTVDSSSNHPPTISEFSKIFTVAIYYNPTHTTQTMALSSNLYQNQNMGNQIQIAGVSSRASSPFRLSLSHTHLSHPSFESHVGFLNQMTRTHQCTYREQVSSLKAVNTA